MNYFSFENLMKGSRAPSRILPSLLYKYNNNEKKIRKKIREKNIIWHFCTPKSASSLLVHLLSNLNLNTIPSMPFYENRKQVSDYSYLLKKMKTYPFSKYFYITHQHSIIDNYLKKYISKNHKVIIQTRNIYLTILSLKDMIVKNKMYTTNSWVALSDKYSDQDLLKLLIYNYVPFHCSFIKSCVENKIEGKKIFINYSNFVRNEKYYIKKILTTGPRTPHQSPFKIPKFYKLNKKKIKFHIGLNRKNTLSPNEKKLIDQIVKIMTKYSTSKVKSLIYQN